MKKLLDAIPKSIRVGPHTYVIEKEGCDTSAWGQCNLSTHEIYLSKDGWPSATKLIESLLHEIGHAIFWEYKMAASDDEERRVGVGSVAWVQVFRDNRWLAPWINAGLRMADKES